MGNLSPFLVPNLVPSQKQNATTTAGQAFQFKAKVIRIPLGVCFSTNEASSPVALKRLRGFAFRGSHEKLIVPD